VWAVDLWVPPTENCRVIRQNGLEDEVFPLRGDARSLPFADAYFDVVFSLDAYHYFGTAVEYLGDHLLPIVKPGGQLGMISPAATAPLPQPLPAGVASWVHRVNSVAWWREHWDRSPGVSVEMAEALPGGREMWIRWDEAMLPGDDDDSDELDLLKSPIGEHLGFVRMTARKDHPDR